MLSLVAGARGERLHRDPIFQIAGADHPENLELFERQDVGFAASCSAAALAVVLGILAVVGQRTAVVVPVFRSVVLPQARTGVCLIPGLPGGIVWMWRRVCVGCVTRDSVCE